MFFHFSAVLILGFYFVWGWFEFYRKRVKKQLLANCTQNVFVWKGCGFGVPSFGPWIHSRFVIDSIPPHSVLRLCVNWNLQSFCLLHCQFNLRLCICSSRRGGWNSNALSIEHILYVLQHMLYVYSLCAFVFLFKAFKLSNNSMILHVEVSFLLQHIFWWHVF